MKKEEKTSQQSRVNFTFENASVRSVKLLWVKCNLKSSDEPQWIWQLPHSLDGNAHATAAWIVASQCSHLASLSLSKLVSSILEYLKNNKPQPEVKNSNKFLPLLLFFFFFTFSSTAPSFFYFQRRKIKAKM